MSQVRFVFGVGAVALLAVAAVALAKPSNGGFEKGNFRGWDRFERGGGSWFVYDGNTVPRGLGGNFYRPPRGEFAAAVDQVAPGLNILHRVIRLERGARNKLSFFLAWRNSHDRFFTPNSFDFGGGLGRAAYDRGLSKGPQGQSNQQFRVDLLKPGAEVDSLRKRDILATLFRVRRGTRDQRPYRKQSYNLTRRFGLVGGRVRFRVAEVDNRGVLNVGIDELRQTDRELGEDCPRATARC